MQNIDGQNRQIKMPAIFCRDVFNISADFSCYHFYHHIFFITDTPENNSNINQSTGFSQL